MRYSDQNLLNRSRSGLDAAIQWWRSQWRDMLPASWTGPRRRGSSLVLDVGRDGAQLLVERGRQTRTIEADIDTAASADAIARHGGRELRRGIGIRIALSDCFTRHVDLPASARGDFARVLNLQLERVTPFKSTDVFQAHRTLGKGTSPGTLAVQHIVAKKATIEPLLAQCRAARIPVAFVDCWDPSRRAPLPVDFLAADADAAGRRVPGWLLALACALGIGAVSGDIVKQDAALASLTAQTSALTGKLRRLRSEAETTRSAGEAARRILDNRSARPSTTAIIEELTRIIPDDAHLRQLRLERDGVDITGIATSSVALLPLIEASPLFRNARLTAPVVSDAKDGRERFGIHMQVRQAARAAMATTSPQPAGGDK